MCCEPLEDVPSVPLGKTGVETVENYINLRNELIAEGFLETKKRRYSKACAKCTRYKLGHWKPASLIEQITLSMYPSPCQFDCMYCFRSKRKIEPFSPEITEEYNIVFEALDYLRKFDLISPDCSWFVACGEISIHPFKNKIMDLIGYDEAIFYSNCSVFDKRIAENLSANPKSLIRFSIDAGTSETWYKIKGVNNWDTVINNLNKYNEISQVSNQITLKYIVFPGINDSKQDFESIVEIMKKLNINKMLISRDVREKDSISESKKNELAEICGYFKAMLIENNMLPIISHLFAPDEKEIIDKIAAKMFA
jgi:wyosine [tRNA(Phe)-imidazoG37] synthetase (radical SAM superfamily)